MRALFDAKLTVLEVQWDFASFEYLGMPVEFEVSFFRVHPDASAPRSLLMFGKDEYGWKLDLLFLPIK